MEKCVEHYSVSLDLSGNAIQAAGTLALARAFKTALGNVECPDKAQGSNILNLRDNPALPYCVLRQLISTLRGVPGLATLVLTVGDDLSVEQLRVLAADLVDCPELEGHSPLAVVLQKGRTAQVTDSNLDTIFCQPYSRSSQGVFEWANSILEHYGRH